MNLFASLVDRALGRAPVLQRRRPTVFEPAKNAVLATRDSTDLLREEQSYAEAENPGPRESTVLRAEPDEARAESQAERSNASSTLTPKANDITIIEEQPAFKAPALEADEAEDGGHNLPLREQTLTPEPPQQLSKDPSVNSLAPSLETIVEANSEQPVALQQPGDENPFDEIDLLADTAENAEASIANNIVVLQSIAQKQASEQTDESRLLKPMQQRRPTRQQMQRSARALPKSQPEQLETPTLPTINVTIGRVEIRASAPVKRGEPARPTGPKLSLEEYLRGRGRGN